MATEQEPSSSVVEVSLKQTVTLIIAFITAIGAVAVAYYNNKPDDTDRFYGSQGRANTKAIEHIREIDKDLKMIVDDYARTKPLMIQRVTSVENYQRNREIEFNTHVQWINGIVREFSIADTEMRMQLGECLRRLP